MQVSRLVYKLKEESDWITESITRKRLREKITALPQLRLVRATDALAMILDGVKGSLEPPATESKFTFSMTLNKTSSIARSYEDLRVNSGDNLHLGRRGGDTASSRLLRVAGPGFVFSATPPVLPNLPRVKLALLKSILTGTFIDVQFYAYNAIGNNMPLNPRPLFTSSIVIEEWGPAITTRKQEDSSQLTRL